MAGLRRGAGPDAYVVSGTLEGVDGPGRRTVRELDVRGLGPDAVGGLSALPAFGDLEDLTLERVHGVDLAPLAQTGVRGLRLLDIAELDLAVLAELKLEGLLIAEFRDCAMPATLRLSASLRGLSIFNDGPSLSGDDVRILVERIDWSLLGGLRMLDLSVGGNHELAPAVVDLGFLRHLPELVTLRMEDGVVHAGPGPSPLEPPFAGLSRKLRWVRVSAVDPEPLKAALEAFIAPPRDDGDGPQGVTVYQREAAAPAEPAWTIREFEGDDGFGVYGSLQQALGQGSEETEYKVVKRVRALIASADPALLKRLDFDPEAGGTGIYAERRQDLEGVLRILGLGR